MYVGSLFVSPDGANLFAQADNYVYRSSNDGTTWVKTGLIFTAVSSFVSTFNGTNLFAGSPGSGVFLSTSNGTSWTAVNSGLMNTNVSSLAVSGINLLAGTNGGGIFLSTNSGTSWSAINAGLTNTKVKCLAVSGLNLFAGTTDGGVFLSTNNGANWTPVNAGLMKIDVNAIAVFGTNLFIGNDGGGVWRRALSEMLTSVHHPLSELPTQFNLKQNYPNPFNPTTKIGFSVPVKSFVSLRIYDPLGRVVAEPVNAYLTPGNYETQFDGEGFGSGIYFYSLQAGSFVQTRRLLLLR
jgi:hypothetical protein